MSSKTITIETKIKDVDLYPDIENYSKFYTYLEKVLFNDIANAKVNDNSFRNSLKKKYISKYNIHARMFNSLWCDVDAKIKSLKELQKINVKEMKSNIDTLEKKIKKNEEYLAKGKKGKVKIKPHEILEIKERLFYWRIALDKLKGKTNRPSETKIVFGTKDFYKQQWTVYNESHNEWLKLWKNARTNHFSFLGSKDESNGNQLCQYKDKVLHVRMPYDFKSKHLNIPVDFSSDNSRRQKQYFEYFDKAVESKQALSYKFLKCDNGFWYVQCSFEISSEHERTDNGSIGVDFNYGDIVEASVDWFGNMVDFKHHKFELENKTTEQTEQITSGIINELVKRAKEQNRFITVESLDLGKCKQGYNKVKNKKVSSMQYSDFLGKLEVKCTKEKVGLNQVNPAFTSVIGDLKYSNFYGIDRHTASAVVIGRRGLGFKDKLTKPIIHVLHWGEGRKFAGIFRHGHHWKHWSFVHKNLETSLKKFNSIQGSALNVNMLKSRFNPDFCVVGNTELFDKDNSLTGCLSKSHM